MENPANMYRRVLAETPADDGIRRRGWSAERFLDVARVVLLGIPRRILGRPDANSHPSN